MNVFAINWVALLVAAVSSMVVGSLWYSPLLFGKPWMKLMGITEAHMNEMKKKSMGMTYFGAFLNSLLMAFVLSVFIQTLQLVSPEVPAWKNGLMVALWVWLGFVATVTMGSVFWENRPLKLYFINNANHLVTLLVMAIILSLWP